MRDIMPGPQGELVVERCEITHVVSRNFWWWLVGENHTRSTDLAEENCLRQRTTSQVRR